MKIIAKIKIKKDDSTSFEWAKCGVSHLVVQFHDLGYFLFTEMTFQLFHPSCFPLGLIWIQTCFFVTKIKWRFTQTILLMFWRNKTDLMRKDSIKFLSVWLNEDLNSKDCIKIIESKVAKDKNYLQIYVRNHFLKAEWG